MRRILASFLRQLLSVYLFFMALRYLQWVRCWGEIGPEGQPESSSGREPGVRRPGRQSPGRGGRNLTTNSARRIPPRRGAETRGILPGRFAFDDVPPGARCSRKPLCSLERQR